MEIYMRKDEIRNLMKKKGYFGKGLDTGFLLWRKEENSFELYKTKREPFPSK